LYIKFHSYPNGQDLLFLHDAMMLLSPASSRQLVFATRQIAVGDKSRSHAMRADRPDSPIYVALVLALIAAIASAPRSVNTPPAAQIRSLQAIFPEAGTFAAAQGEPPEVGAPRL
jgi:hypothetical protein